MGRVEGALGGGAGRARAPHLQVQSIPHAPRSCRKPPRRALQAPHAAPPRPAPRSGAGTPPLRAEGAPTLREL